MAVYECETLLVTTVLTSNLCYSWKHTHFIQRGFKVKLTFYKSVLLLSENYMNTTDLIDLISVWSAKYTVTHKNVDILFYNTIQTNKMNIWYRKLLRLS